MSKIRLHGSSSGYTEIAPVAASGNNTLTLPNDGTIISKDSNGAVGVTSIAVGTGVTIGDGRVTCTTLHGSAANCTQIPAANIVGVCTSGFAKTGGFGGITMAEIWRVNTEYTSNSGNTVYPTNWERDDNNRAGYVGSSGMSQSSGVFTFPSTGIYQVTWQGYGRAAQDSGNTLVANGIYATGNNSSYSVVSIMYYTCPNLTTYNYAWGEVKAIIDVTDTSNVKVKLSNYSANSMTWECNSGYNLNHATFIRLGDT